MKIGIVTGEVSGDYLGADLIRSLKVYYPQAEFVGIAGEKMSIEGCRSLFPQERLAVMGIVEPLKRVFELLSIRRQLFRHFVDQQFDVFIGIDSPDFNLPLAAKLRRHGLKAVHYVSPSVWAWRQGRIKTIRSLLTLC